MIQLQTKMIRFLTKIRFVAYKIKLNYILESVLTYITLRGPLCCGTFTPNKFFTCDVSTCTAAPVVKPETSVSDRSTLSTPSLHTPSITYTCHMEGHISKGHTLGI